MPKRSSGKKKAAYHHGNLRESLLLATLKVIESDGLENLSLRSVASRAGVTHAAPYAHFRDKDQLIAAAKAEGFKRLASSLVEALSRAKTPDEKLEASAIAYGSFALAHPSLFQVMFSKPLPAIPQGIDYVTPGAEMFRTLEGFVEESIRVRTGGGSLRQDPRQRAAIAAWSLVHGFVSIRLGGPFVHVYPDLQDDKHFLKGLKVLARFVIDKLPELAAS